MWSYNLSETIKLGNGEQVQVRTMRKGDLPDLQILYVSLSKRVRKYYAPPYFRSGELLKVLLSRLLFCISSTPFLRVLFFFLFPIGFYYTLIVESLRERKIISYGGLCEVMYRRASLGICVKDDYLGLGVGSVVMTRMIEKAREFGFKEIVVHVAPENKTSFYFARRHGFKVRGRAYRKGSPNGEKYDIEMSLKPS